MTKNILVLALLALATIPLTHAAHYDANVNWRRAFQAERDAQEKAAINQFLSANSYQTLDQNARALSQPHPNRALDNMRPLHLAAYQGKTNIVRLLIKYGARINTKDKVGKTALRRAVDLGHHAAAAELLTHGADANIGDRKNFVPLHIAAFLGHAHVVTLLMQHNADINTHDKYGKTPLRLAIQYNRDVCVNLLRQNGAQAY